MMMHLTPQAICLLLIVAASYSLAMKSSPLLEHSLEQRTSANIFTRDIRLQRSASVTRKRNTPNKEDTTLRTSLIIVFSVGITITFLLMMIICAICMLRRAQRGRFCCLKPKIRHPRSNHVSDSSSENEEEQASPPQYDTAYLLNESPPVYQDALQDIVIATGVRTSNVQLPPYEQSHSETASTEISETAMNPCTT